MGNVEFDRDVKKELRGYLYQLTTNVDRAVMGELEFNGNIKHHFFANFCGSITHRLVMEFASEDLADVSVVESVDSWFIKTPQTWWQHFKERWFPTFIRMGLIGPVLYLNTPTQKVKLKNYSIKALYPQQPIPNGRVVIRSLPSVSSYNYD